MTDLRQIKWIKQRLQTALDTLEEIGDSTEYQALKALIVEKTGGQKLEDLIDDANRFSEGVDDLEAIALQKEETTEVKSTSQPQSRPQPEPEPGQSIVIGFVGGFDDFWGEDERDSDVDWEF